MRTHPIWKKSRALGFSLLENKKEFSRGKKRTTPPGQHGLKKVRNRRISLYASQNREKQKLRFLYRLKEKQLKNLFSKLKKKKGNVFYNLLVNLESRLDNLVFRSGLVNTRSFARQLVNHGHLFLVEQKPKRVNLPGYQVKIGSVITLKEKMRNNPLIKQQLEQNPNFKAPNFLQVNREKFEITYSQLPSLPELEKQISGINLNLVAEHYNKRI